MTDRPSYIPLTLVDRDAQDIFEAALLAGATKMPDWAQHEGDPMVTSLELSAQQIDELGFMANRLPQAMAEIGIANLHQVSRDMGTAPSVTVQFNVSANGTIPAGTELVLELSGSDAVTFLTDEDLAAVAPNGTVVATATVITSSVNGTPAGTVLRVRSTTSAIIDSAVTTTDVAGGVDPETADAWYARAQLKAARSTQTLGPALSFETYALEQAGIPKAHAINKYDPAVGPVGSNLGHITVAVYGEGATISGGDKTALAAAMQALSVADLQVHVVDPTITAVAVTMTVYRRAAYTNAQALAAVTAALTSFLATATWGWGATVYRNDIVALVEALPEIERVATGHPTTPAADLALTGAAPLASPGVFTITVLAA